MNEKDEENYDLTEQFTRMSGYSIDTISKIIRIMARWGILVKAKADMTT